VVQSQNRCEACAASGPAAASLGITPRRDGLYICDDWTTRETPATTPVTSGASRCQPNRGRPRRVNSVDQSAIWNRLSGIHAGREAARCRRLALYKGRIRSVSGGARARKTNSQQTAPSPSWRAATPRAYRTWRTGSPRDLGGQSRLAPGGRLVMKSTLRIGRRGRCKQCERQSASIRRIHHALHFRAEVTGVEFGIGRNVRHADGGWAG
jgi:hypothetical protein